MTKGKRLFLVVLVVVILLIAASLVYLKTKGENGDFAKPGIKSATIKIKSISKQRTEMSVMVNLDNPLPFGATLDSLYYKVSVAGYEVARNYTSMPGEINSFEENYLVLPVSLDNQKLFEVLEKLHQVQIDSAEYKMDMRVYPAILNGQVVEYSYSFKGPVPFIPEVKVEEFKVEKAGLKESVLNIRLKIKNKNTFPYEFNGLRYSVKLDTVQIGRGVTPQPIRIPAEGEETVDVDVELRTMKAISKGLKSIFKPNETSYSVRLKTMIPELPMGENVEVEIELKDDHVPMELIKELMKKDK